MLCTGAAILEDFRDRLLVAFGGEWSVGFLTKHNPGLELADSLPVYRTTAVRSRTACLFYPGR